MAEPGVSSHLALESNEQGSTVHNSGIGAHSAELFLVAFPIVTEDIRRLVKEES